MRTEFSSDKEKHNYFNRMTHDSTARERRASPNTNRNTC